MAVAVHDKIEKNRIFLQFRMKNPLLAAESTPSVRFVLTVWTFS